MILSPLDSIGGKTSLNLDIDNAVNSYTLFRKAEQILESKVIFFTLRYRNEDQYQWLGTDPYIKLQYNFNKTPPYITRHCYIATIQRYN